MKFLDTPPVTAYAVTTSTDALLRLEGPSTGSRLSSSVAAGFGTVFAGMALRMARAAPPGPFRLLPLAFTAVGAGLALVNGAEATMRCSVEAEKSGVTFTWGLGQLVERKLVIAAGSIEAFEVTQHHRNDRDGYSTTRYQLVLVKRDVEAIAFESFSTQAQANLRKKAIETVTRG